MSEGDKPKQGNVFNIDRIRRLVELMEQHDLSEVDLRQDDERINLKRGPQASAPVYYAPPAAAAPPSPSPPPAAASSAPADVGDAAHIVTITSPMVGTFYNRANPESQPFVSVGSMVRQDTVVCIIEAMKVFNEIPAEVSGKIVAVLAENEQPIEYGKPLFKVDTSA